jgi:hypothetical protein
MANPIKVYTYGSHLKWGSSSLLIQLWKAMTLSVDCNNL